MANPYTLYEDTYGSNEGTCGATPDMKHTTWMRRYASVSSYRGPRVKNSVNPFSVEKWEVMNSPYMHICSLDGLQQSRWQTGHIVIYCDYFGCPLYRSVFFNYENQVYYDRMLAALFSKANSPKLAGATIMAEGIETLNFVKTGLMNLFNLVKGMKALGKAISSPADTWMGYKYGLMPLILTITDAINALESKKEKEKVQEYSVTEFVEENSFIMNPFYKNLYWRYKSTYQLRNGGALWIKSQFDPSPFGFSGSDIVSAAWEIVPLSFVIDWVVGVGDWISSFRDTDLVVNKSYGTKIIDHTMEIWLDEDQPNFTVNEGPSKGSPLIVHGYKMDRMIDVSPPSLPTVTWRNESFTHVIEGIILLCKSIR